MVRLKDIALRAGVSIMTVSKVMRNEPDVSVATKARIRKLATEMGYVPDSTAQSLRTRTTKLLGLLIPSITNPIFARTVLAIEERAHELGYDLILSQTLGTDEREESCIRRLLARRIDGLFICPVYRLAPEAKIYQELVARKIPTVIIGQTAPFCRHFPNVEPDDVGGGYAVTRHLLQLGHRRIAIFTGPLASPWAQERLEGYRRALREHDMEVDDRLVFNAGTTIEDGGKAALQLLNESSDATAVFGCNDLVAIGAAEVFLQQGVRIPDDLSLAGFGNILTSEHFRVPLTTIRQPKHGLGLIAVDILFRMLRGETAESRRVACELLVRASTAAPPDKPRLKKTGTEAA